MSHQVADILIPLALDTTYSYAVPEGLTLKEGDVVQVPLATREVVGVVWELRQGAAANFKKVTGVVDTPSLSPNMRKFLEWIAWYTLAPKGSALSMGLRLVDETRIEVTRVGVRLTGSQPKRMTPARQKVIEAAREGTIYLKRELADAAGVSVGVIDGLVDEGTLEAVALAAEPVAGTPDPGFIATNLSDGQREAAERLIETLSEDPAPATLLEGVTGAGKTEVYFEAVAETIRQGRQALILMPEIALTAQFLDRFEARFGVKPACWHSGVSGRKRERLFAAIAAGDVKVVAGARSALFLPYPDLGLIVVDEEHETAYKQEDGVHYHARDMAVVRGRIEGAPVILASATPSIESRVNVERGRYHHVRLPERFGGRSLPQIRAIDLRKEAIPKGRWLSPSLVAAMEENAARGEQSLLFLNRRGYAPLTLCRACAHRYECPNCSAWLVEHRFRRALVCHHCGHVERTPQACVSCGSVDSLVPCGPGVERIAEEVAELFPDKRSVVLSSDFPGGTERLKAELAAVAAGEVDIVIGTQLVAKGHNFPLLTLVGVLDADIGLTSGDPRAAERTFQMLQQVTGRAGRGEKPGRGLVQTWQPDHPVIAALVSGDAERFYREETHVREVAGLPPFGRLAALVVSAAEREAAEAHARAMAKVASPPPGVTVLGPAEAPLALIRGRYRYRILVKTEREVDLQAYLRDWLTRCPKVRGNTKVSIDVDPQSFL
ncbi:primosomal protein N' [Microvirga pudoricolor]|uniref:primosomal protein N' n=1 Tax=Microvirga pudoricolor TaxID=2778729 RepID=UPI00194FA7CF|nr:primosomal protein N' [Microvirga pudoricolor]MBM6593540.1 primosomal protein N' [Microvirga pudoricolor]